MSDPQSQLRLFDPSETIKRHDRAEYLREFALVAAESFWSHDLSKFEEETFGEKRRRLRAFCKECEASVVIRPEPHTLPPIQGTAVSKECHDPDPQSDE